MAHRDACAKGHRYTEATLTWRRDGTRRCLECERVARLERRMRKQLRAEAVQPQPLTGQDPRR